MCHDFVVSHMFSPGSTPQTCGETCLYMHTRNPAQEPAAISRVFSRSAWGRYIEEKLRANRSPFPRAEGFGVHELIDPRETRPFLCDWIEWIQVRLEGLKGPVTFNMRP